MATYRDLLAQAGAGTLHLPDRDFDTGALTKPMEYRMADDTYSLLAINLAQKDPGSIDPALRQNVLAYFNDPDQSYATKRDPMQWQKTLVALGKLRTAQASASRVQQ
jgi:hypothetical protein